MAWTQADIDALKAAIATGVKSVAYHDKTVTYHSVDDMLKALAMMQAEVNVSSGANEDTFSRVSYSRE